MLSCPESLFLSQTCCLQRCTFRHLSAFSTRNNFNFVYKRRQVYWVSRKMSFLWKRVVYNDAPSFRHFLQETTSTLYIKEDKCIKFPGKCLSFENVLFTTMHLPFGIFYKKQLQLLCIKKDKYIKLSGKCLSFANVLFTTMHLPLGIFYKKQL